MKARSQSPGDVKSRIRWSALSLTIVLFLSPVLAFSQTAIIGMNQYAFQYQPGASATLVGLYFNSVLNQYEFRDLTGAPLLAMAPVSHKSNFTGSLGVNSPNPLRPLHVNGSGRIGGSSDYLAVDASGNLRFFGSAGYLIANNTYAFKSDGSTNGLFFNQTGNQYEFIDNTGTVTLAIGANSSNAGKVTGTNTASFPKLGVKTTSPSTDLQVLGTTRLGSATAYANIGALGNLTFVGGAEYRVANDAYAFRSSTSVAGLLFNVTDNEFQLINSAGLPVFMVEATGGGSGNTTVNGNLTIEDEILVNTVGSLARVDAVAEFVSYLSAVRGEGANDTTYGYLGVVGKDSHDGTSLNIAGNEIGVLGIALSGASGTIDDYGVFGYSDNVGIHAEHSNGNNVDLATDSWAIEVNGDALIQGELDVDSIEVDHHMVIDNNADISATENGPLTVGFETGVRLTLSKSAIQAKNAIGTTLMELNPLGGNINIGNGGGIVNIATDGGGDVNIGMGGGVVNLDDILYTDPVNERIGIGDATPDYTLTVKHPTGISNNGLAIINSLTNTTWQFYSFIDGDLGLFEDGVQKGSFDNVTGNYIPLSDRVLKTSIRKLTDVSSKLNTLKPKKYRFRSNSSRDAFGFIAQDVELVFPELVKLHQETGYKSVSYTELIPILVAGFQEQQQLIEAQDEKFIPRTEMESVRDELREALNRISKLEEDLSSCCVKTMEDQGDQRIASLGQNVPNPFSNTTLISYYLPASTKGAEIRITDFSGRTVHVIDLVHSGYTEIEFSNEMLGAGTYLYTLVISGQAVQSRQMVIME